MKVLSGPLSELQTVKGVLKFENRMQKPLGHLDPFGPFVTTKSSLPPNK